MVLILAVYPYYLIAFWEKRRSSELSKTRNFINNKKFTSWRYLLSWMKFRNRKLLLIDEK